MSDDWDTVGQRCAEFRRLRGLRQADLAEAAGYTVGHLRHVENGRKPASPAFISAVARALAVSVAQLLGQPYDGQTPHTARIHAVIGHLRRELAVYAHAPVDDAPVQDLDALAARVSVTAELRHGVQLEPLGEMLPDLLADLRRAAHEAKPGTHAWERVHGMLAETYAAASQVAYKLGYADLASLAVDRYEWAADRSADPLAVCVGDYQRAGELMMVAEYPAAEGVLTAAQRRIEDEVRRDAAAPVLATWGNLALKQGLIAARAGHAGTAWDHYAVAREAADRLGADRDDYRLLFGPTNVGIWGVSLAAELDDAGEAVRRGEHVRIPTGYAAERVSHHHIDLARARLHTADHVGALRELATARKIAPVHTRYHPMVRETVGALVRASRRTSGSLDELVSWLGLTA